MVLSFAQDNRWAWAVVSCQGKAVNIRMRSWGIVLVLGLALASCGDADSRREITRTSTVPARLGMMARSNASSAERFGLEAPTPPLPAEELPHAFEWRLPESWQPLPPRPLRVASFAIDGAADAECYVSILNNDGGGTERNINRWCNQMGRRPLSAEEIDALPRLTVLGQPAPLVEIAGSYRDLTGEIRPDYLLVGVVCLLEDQCVFVKLIGPEGVVRTELNHFKAFCEALRWRWDIKNR